MKRLIIFLIRKRLGLKKFELFKFSNQKSDTASYYFGNDALIKVDNGVQTFSNVSLNWLLNDDCEIDSQMEALE